MTGRKHTELQAGGIVADT